jgi:hypothetical protein
MKYLTEEWEVYSLPSDGVGVWELLEVGSLLGDDMGF